MGRAHERTPVRELYTVFRDFRAILGWGRGGVIVTGRFNEKRPGTTTQPRHGFLRNVYVTFGQFLAGKGAGCRDWAFREANNAQARPPSPDTDNERNGFRCAGARSFPIGMQSPWPIRETFSNGIFPVSCAQTPWGLDGSDLPSMVAGSSSSRVSFWCTSPQTTTGQQNRTVVAILPVSWVLYFQRPQRVHRHPVIRRKTLVLSAYCHNVQGQSRRFAPSIRN